MAELEFPGIQNRNQFVEFASDLHRKASADPYAFENNTIPRFLESLAAFVEERQGIPEGTDWNFISLVLYAGLNYE
ncbi:hypothetical protein ACFXK0_15770 [Nocardia sp. NPDC059177]|uniref:DUF7660 family protein n=1 Tax=Nocardia sp. NPDC059177 TaxID=3346759 RepID=UPI0036AD3FAF